MFRGKMRFFLIIFITACFLFLLREDSFAQQTRILVAPVNISTINSATGLYPNISELIAGNIINELNKNLNIEAPDLNTAENLINTYGLWNNYTKLLINYKDRRIIDYKTCSLLKEKIALTKSY
jgi:hypothetical protein